MNSGAYGLIMQVRMSYLYGLLLGQTQHAHEEDCRSGSIDAMHIHPVQSLLELHAYCGSAVCKRSRVCQREWVRQSETCISCFAREYKERLRTRKSTVATWPCCAPHACEGAVMLQQLMQFVHLCSLCSVQGLLVTPSRDRNVQYTLTLTVARLPPLAPRQSMLAK